MTEEERRSDQNKSTSDPDLCKSCPHCGMEMEKGSLRLGGEGITRVFIEAQSNQEYLPLSVCFCRECGKVMLFTGR